MYDSKVVEACQIIMPNVLFIKSGRYEAVEPVSPYCEISLITESRVSSSETNMYTPINEETVIGYENLMIGFEVAYQFTFYGSSKSESENLARRFSIGLESSQFTREFYVCGLSILNHEVVTRLIESTDSYNYLKDAVSVIFLSNRMDSFESEWINEVEINGTVNDYNFEVDVNYGD